MKKIFLLLVTVLTAMTAWASTYTVENDSNNFIITRNGSGVETIYYRTVSLSAMAGENYTERTGLLIFSQDEVQKTIPVREVDIDSYIDWQHDVYNLRFAIQTGLARTYRFELLDEYGNLLAYKDRNIAFNQYYQMPTAYSNTSVTDLIYFDDNGNLKSGTGNKYLDLGTSENLSGWIKVTDAGYSQRYCRLKTDIFNNSPYVRIYCDSLNMKVYATVFFKQKEEDDGYQYIQILDNNYQTYDGNDPDGAVNTPSISQYKACFELSKSGVTTDEHYQFFPHRYDFVNKAAEQNAGLSHYSFDYDNSYLYQQKYVSSSVHSGSSGSLIFSPTNYYITVRFDAAGKGDDNWYFKDLKARVALVDVTEPTVMVSKYRVSAGRHSRSNTIYVSVPFNEIVTVSGTPTLSTTWGTLSYLAGSGSNVLTFSGTISNSATGTFTVNSYSGTITDLAGNAFTGQINKSFGTNLDPRNYSISYNLAGGSWSSSSGGSHPSSYTDLSGPITLSQPVRAGYTFLGWTGSNGTTPQTTVTIPAGSTGNRNYTANWEVINYNITYNLDGGTLPEGQSNPTTYNAQTATFTLINPTKPDYLFLGWTGSNGETPQTSVTITQGSTGDRTYTANWQLRPPRYTFNSETGALVLNWGEFNKDDKWGSDVPASAVMSVTATDEVSFTGDCSELFQGFTNCTSFDLNNVNTSNVTNMANMFTGCAYMTSLDISNWNTGNVTNMKGMFLQCNRLNSLDLSHFNTTNVTNMAYMFDNCKSLKSLNVMGWDTGNVTEMYNMFNCCSSLKKLDLMGWDTGNVTMMYCMFTACDSLTTILVDPDWNTANVTNSIAMFGGCYSLVGGMGTTYDENHLDKEYARIDGGPECPGYFTLKLPRYTFDSETGALVLNWGEFNKNNKWGDDVNPKAVKSVIATDEVSFTGDCSQLFYEFEKCTSMDLNSVNTSSATNMDKMFYRCFRLTSLDISNWDTGNVTSMELMFVNVDDLTSLDLSGWNTSNVTSMYRMFAYSNFTSLNISNWDTGNVTNMECMFGGCDYLTSLNLSRWNTSNVTNMHEMFYYCDGLTSLNASGWNTGNVTDMSDMFEHCESLVSLKISNWNPSKVTDVSEMFSCCYSLTSLDLSGWNTSKVYDMYGLFYNCSNLTTIYVGAEWDTDDIAYYHTNYMFHNCTSLVGGRGTTFNPDHTDKEYAHIDGGPNNPGYFTEPIAAVPGDVDGDGTVTSADITALYSFLLSGDNSGLVNGDQDGDGSITSADVTAVYNIILGI